MAISRNILRLLGEDKATLTVGDLISHLGQYDESLPVYFGYNYGDHWHTEVAAAISDSRVTKVKNSDYHSMMVTNNDSNEDESDDDRVVQEGSAVILTS